MRKNLPIILLSALVVIGLLVGVGYYFQTYRHGKAPEEGLTVVTAESTTASNKRTFLAENKEGDFQLYAQGDKAILVHQGKSKTFSGWSPLPDQGTTQALLYGPERRQKERTGGAIGQWY